MLKCFSRTFSRKANVFDVIIGNKRLPLRRQVFIFRNHSLPLQEKTGRRHYDGSHETITSSPCFLLMAGVASFFRNDPEMESGEEKIIHMIKLAKLSQQVIS